MLKVLNTKFFLFFSVYTSANNTTLQYKVEDLRVFAQTNLHTHPGQDVGVKHVITHGGYNVTRHPWRDLFFVYVKHDIGKLVFCCS